MAFPLSVIDILHTRGAAAHARWPQGYISFVRRRKRPCRAILRRLGSIFPPALCPAASEALRVPAERSESRNPAQIHEVHDLPPLDPGSRHSASKARVNVLMAGPGTTGKIC